MQPFQTLFNLDSSLMKGRAALAPVTWFALALIFLLAPDGFSIIVPSPGNEMVVVAQLVEPRIVIPVVAGSSPVDHPIVPLPISHGALASPDRLPFQR